MRFLGICLFCDDTRIFTCRWAALTSCQIVQESPLLFRLRIQFLLLYLGSVDFSYYLQWNSEGFFFFFKHLSECSRLVVEGELGKFLPQWPYLLRDSHDFLTFICSSFKSHFEHHLLNTISSPFSHYVFFLEPYLKTLAFIFLTAFII